MHLNIFLINQYRQGFSGLLTKGLGLFRGINALEPDLVLLLVGVQHRDTVTVCHSNNQGIQNLVGVGAVYIQKQKQQNQVKNFSFWQFVTVAITFIDFVFLTQGLSQSHNSSLDYYWVLDDVRVG